MMWPWQRYRKEALEAIEVANDARVKDAAAAERKAHAEWLVAASRHSTARLRAEMAKNGWTELLQEAWGRR